MKKSAIFILKKKVGYYYFMLFSFYFIFINFNSELDDEWIGLILNWMNIVLIS